LVIGKFQRKALLDEDALLENMAAEGKFAKRIGLGGAKAIVSDGLMPNVKPFLSPLGRKFVDFWFTKVTLSLGFGLQFDTRVSP
jgi:hypothetical protein